MKKLIITGTVAIACAALCAAVWQRSAEDMYEKRYSRTAEQKIIIHYRDIGFIGSFAEEAEKICEQQQRQTA